MLLYSVVGRGGIEDHAVCNNKSNMSMEHLFSLLRTCFWLESEKHAFLLFYDLICTWLHSTLLFLLEELACN